ncbi:MAG: WYL domain-containing protein [Bacteroidetes bacterium]|nr:MAG: WYL domain-containing protein [Bacteroidota bacterium]
MLANDRRRHLRLPVIDRCLQTPGTRWSAQQLLQAVNEYLAEGDTPPVTIRTIQKDLKYLESLPHNPAPVGFADDGRIRYYYYTDRQYEMEAPATNADQVFALTLAHEVLAQLKGFPMVKEVAALRTLLEKQLATIPEQPFPILLFDEAPELKGIEWLEPLFEAIRAKTSLTIAYRPFEAAVAIEKQIHPWWLKQSNQRWFLFGWSQADHRLDNSPLDRIESIKPGKLPYRQNNHINPVDYFKDMVGVTRLEGAEPEQIKLKVYGKQAHYLHTKRLHASQQMVERQQQYCVFTLQALVNYELTTKILSLGEAVEVLKPETLRKEMMAIWQSGLARYA